MREFCRVACLMAALSGTAALAQETAPETEVTINIQRGLTVDRPYTLAYPETMQLVEDGDDITVATLEYPGAPLQCDALIVDVGASDWTAGNAVATLDRAGTEAGWVADFPGFTIADLGVTQFQSGPALYYEGRSQSSPLGFAASIFHAEAVDGGRTYVFECLADSSIAADAKGLVDFLFANFSTRADGECCTEPAARQPE